jgi:histidinol-phosphate aminotransferase
MQAQSNAPATDIAPTIDAPDRMQRPLNLGLNDGIFAPQAVIQALATFSTRTSLRNYTTSRNDPLRQLIAQRDGVDPDQVFLHNGTGPILKLAIPHLVRQAIKRSPLRIARHLLKLASFPLYTPTFTYSKIPKKAAESGLRVHTLDLSPDNGFRLDLGQLRAFLRARPGIVYLANPNNPTGNVLITRDEVQALIREFPESAFWIDEAYVEYLSPEEHRCVADLVRTHDNLFVNRSFSFAWGMAGLRIGYLLAPTSVVTALEAQVTDYRLGTVQEQAAIAALRDTEHLPQLRRFCEEGRAQLSAGLAAFPGIEVFPSKLNFLLCRFLDQRTGAWLRRELEKRGILIKSFEPYNGHNFDPYFRITLGLVEENKVLLETMAEILKPSN